MRECLGRAVSCFKGAALRQTETAHQDS